METSEGMIDTDGSHASVAVGVPKTGVTPQLIVELPGQNVIIGEVVSFTLIV
jgi:hypothetical protein